MPVDPYTKAEYEQAGGPPPQRVILADDGELPPFMKATFFAAGVLIGAMLIVIGAR